MSSNNYQCDDSFCLKHAENIVRMGFYELEPLENKILRMSKGAQKIFENDKISLLNDLIKYMNNSDGAVYKQALTQVINDFDVSSKTMNHIITIDDHKMKYVSHTIRLIINKRNKDCCTYKILGLIQDITEKYNYETEVSNMAYYDKLTSLPNRAGFEKSVNVSVKLAKNVHKLAIIFLDLDDFKRINDTLGHYIGDQLLCHITNELSSLCKAYKNKYHDTEFIYSDITPCRFGGDEFIICLPFGDNFSIVEKFVKDILKNINKKTKLAEQDIKPSVSIGVSSYPDNGNNFIELLQRADTAMYKSKDKNKNTYHVYSSAMGDRAKQKLAIESELLEAINSDELILYYQPKIDLVSSKIMGYEGLVRWDHSTKGVLSPGVFMDIAEESDLIYEVTNKIIDVFIQDYHNYFYDKNITVSLNLSGKHLTSNLLSHSIFESELEKINPAHVEFEITESMVVQEIEQAITILNIIKDKGFKCSIDDFGTGYSSFNYLKLLPVNTIKVDKIFIDNITTPKDKAILKSIVYMIRELEMKSIVEGVEEYEQLDYLMSIGCNYAQGYLISKPVSFNTLTSREYLNQIYEVSSYIKRRVEKYRKVAK